jgi:hypothetical protein
MYLLFQNIKGHMPDHITRDPAIILVARESHIHEYRRESAQVPARRQLHRDCSLKLDHAAVAILRLVL